MARTPSRKWEQNSNWPIAGQECGSILSIRPFVGEERCVTTLKTVVYSSGLVFRRFQTFLSWKIKGIPSVRCFFILRILKEHFRYLFQRWRSSRLEMASPLRNFPAFWFSFRFSSWIFPSRSFSRNLSQPYWIYKLIILDQNK